MAIQHVCSFYNVLLADSKVAGEVKRIMQPLPTKEQLACSSTGAVGNNSNINLERRIPRRRKGIKSVVAEKCKPQIFQKKVVVLKFMGNQAPFTRREEDILSHTPIDIPQQPLNPLVSSGTSNMASSCHSPDRNHVMAYQYVFVPVCFRPLDSKPN